MHVVGDSDREMDGGWWMLWYVVVIAGYLGTYGVGIWIRRGGGVSWGLDGGWLVE